MIEYNKLDRWTFEIDTDNLVNLVLNGQKTATTSLYDKVLPQVGDLSILTDASGNDVCVIKTKKVILTEFKNITWNLAKLEGETKTLREWQKIHKDYFIKINSSFNDNTKVVFEIFEVIAKF